MKTKITGAAVALSVALLSIPSAANACGGFFCGFQPVDQTAERIIFRVHPNKTVSMAVQIQYQGAAEDFAWVLPLPEVPDPNSLATFPLAAMVGLDARTGPQFLQPQDCFGDLLYAEAASDGGGDGNQPPSAGGDVIVHIQQQVGNYEAAVVESNDAKALHTWLVSNGYRVGTSMQKIVELYINEGMKFLALKLVAGAGVEDIQPFKLTLPGEVPSIPLRLTAIAAEPEMSLAIFVLGDMRYGGANWQNLSIDPKQIVWSYQDAQSFWGPLQTNYTKLVAEAVDAAGGQGWVTQMAGSTEQYLELLRRQKENIEQSLAQSGDEGEWRMQQEATLENIDALLGMMDGATYLTRLYTRVSAEEMASDPTFKRVAGGDVANTIQLERYVNGRDMCPWVDEEQWPETLPETTTPCDFATCGAGGICRDVQTDNGLVAGCGCVPGATARATVDADGNDGVVCQDQRMSFLNPGDRDDDGANPLPDPCVDFSCGSSGRCVAVNLTPTCVCDQGMVATGGFVDSTRVTECQEPIVAVPSRFYNSRLPAIEIEAGREVTVPEPDPYVDASLAGGGCSVDQDGAPFGLAVLGLGLALALVTRRRSGQLS